MRSSSRVLRARLARAAALPLLALMFLFGGASMATAADDVVVLATESHGEDLPGLEPKTAADEDNQFRPDDYEANFLWGAAVGLGVLVAGGVAGLAGLYWLMVVRPSQANQPQA